MLEFPMHLDTKQISLTVMFIYVNSAFQMRMLHDETYIVNDEHSVVLIFTKYNKLYCTVRGFLHITNIPINKQKVKGPL